MIQGRCTTISSKPALLQFFTFALLLLSCSSGRSNGTMSDSVPKDFKLSFGEGGGITGRWIGFTIVADGSVLKWDGGRAEENVTARTKLSSEELSTLWQRVKILQHVTDSVLEKGNITYYLRLTANATSREFTWTSNRSESVRNLEELLHYCQSIIERKLRK